MWEILLGELRSKEQCANYGIICYCGADSNWLETVHWSEAECSASNWQLGIRRLCAKVGHRRQNW